MGFPNAHINVIYKKRVWIYMKHFGMSIFVGLELKVERWIRLACVGAFPKADESKKSPPSQNNYKSLKDVLVRCAMSSMGFFIFKG